MRAASARAIASQRNAATREGLKRAVAWSRQWSAEFPFCLANHLPMVLVALHRMGASDERLEAYCHIYHQQNGLVPLPEPIGEITRDNWREFLGAREREADYRAFFDGEVARLGATPAAIHYLSQLMPGVAASATHALMRMAYATLTDSDEETSVALAYWAATYLPLGAPRGLAPSTDDPAEVLAFMYGPAAFRHVEPERDLLWHFMRAVAEKPEFEPVVDMLAIGPETHDRVAGVSLALYAATLDFCALHAVTGTHWLRMIAPRTPDKATRCAISGSRSRRSCRRWAFRLSPARTSSRRGGACPCPTGPRSIARRSPATTSMISVSRSRPARSSSTMATVSIPMRRRSA